MTLIDQIRDLIAEGETQRSLDELYKYVKESNADVIDNLVMLRSRMQNLQRAVHNGTMDDHAAALERAKINEAILKLLPQLTPEYLAEASKRREPIRHTAAATPSEVPATPARNMKMIYIAAGVILFIIILIIAFSGGGGDVTNAEQTPDALEQGVEGQSAPADYQNSGGDDGSQQQFDNSQQQYDSQQQGDENIPQEEGVEEDSTQ